MPFDPSIPNATVYNEEMLKPLIDKLFFADKVDDASVFVDFGCADGVMLGAMRMLFPSHTYIGFDVSEPMLDEARQKVPGVTFTSDWEEVKRLCREAKGAGRKNCLVLSSVIHEARNYLTGEEQKIFWSRVWGDEEFSFDVIAIRDMMVNRSTSRPSDPLSVARIRQIYDTDRLTQWERQWGSISENWSLTHFLLTYRYVANWSREVEENYLPVALEDFLASIPKRYIPTYEEHFVLPFLRRQVRRDFRIGMPDATHLKLILEREDIW